ncbi:hypothetical protein ACPA54_38735 [Uniformispora flossi]|uniref:hypothetical protein n=1 Tax=Uniformispora flossi TaxID=3390723 RepID=UPI003C2E03C7
MAKSKHLTGYAWRESPERLVWETKVMARRYHRYRATLAVARTVNRLTPRKNRPSFEVTYWERVRPGRTTYLMPKSETMTADGQTNWLTRAARTLSVDEYLQTIEEHERRKASKAMAAAGTASDRERLLEAYERRRHRRVLKSAAPGARRRELARAYLAGEAPYRMGPDERRRVLDDFARGKDGLPPQFHLTGVRDNDVRSYLMMDLAWVKGEVSTAMHRRFGAARSQGPGAFFGPHYTVFKSRDFPGGELNPGFRRGRVQGDLHWQEHASKKLEKKVIRGSRILRLRHFGRYLKAEANGAAKSPPDTGYSAFTDPTVLAVAGAFGNTLRHGRALQVPAPLDEPAPPRTLPPRVDIVAAVVGFTPLVPTAVFPPPSRLATVPLPGGAVQRGRSAAAPAPSCRGCAAPRTPYGPFGPARDPGLVLNRDA